MRTRQAWAVLIAAVIWPASASYSMEGAVPDCAHLAAVCGGQYTQPLFGCVDDRGDGVAVYDIYLSAGTTVFVAASGYDAIPLTPPAGAALYDPAGNMLDGIYPAYLGFTVTVVDSGVYSIVVNAPGNYGYGLLIECTGGPAGCVPTANTLCLNQGRFSVTTTWQTHDAASSGTAVQLTDEAGYFWFFSESNIEVIIKVLDACASPFESFWLFAAGLTNVGVTTRVTDTASGQVKVYTNDRGRPFLPVQDTNAFTTCP